MARWRFFGHVLRLPREAPAQLALEWYLNISCNKKIAGWRGRPRCNLAAINIEELGQSRPDLRLQTVDDLNKLQAIASNRTHWRKLISHICC